MLKYLKSFVSVHGVEVAATYLVSLLGLVVSHTSTAGNSSVLALVAAAALAAVKVVKDGLAGK